MAFLAAPLAALAAAFASALTVAAAAAASAAEGGKGTRVRGKGRNPGVEGVRSRGLFWGGVRGQKRAPLRRKRPGKGGGGG